MSVTFLTAVTKYLTKIGRFILAQSLGVQSIFVRKTGQLELEAALYIVATIKKQRQMNPDAWLTVSFSSLLSLQNTYTHCQWDGAIQFQGRYFLS